MEKKKKYCYLNFESSDSGDIIIKYDERVPSKSGTTSLDHVEYSYESHVEVISKSDLDSEDGLKNLGAMIRNLATATC